MGLQALKRKRNAVEEPEARKITIEDILKPPQNMGVEYLTHLERFYWRNLSFQTTMYAADRIFDY